jgi:hypothetical protein
MTMSRGNPPVGASMGPLAATTESKVPETPMTGADKKAETVGVKELTGKEPSKATPPHSRAKGIGAKLKAGMSFLLTPFLKLAQFIVLHLGFGKIRKIPGTSEYSKKEAKAVEAESGTQRSLTVGKHGSPPPVPSREGRPPLPPPRDKVKAKAVAPEKEESYLPPVPVLTDEERGIKPATKEAKKQVRFAEGEKKVKQASQVEVREFVLGEGVQADETRYREDTNFERKAPPEQRRPK